MLYPWVCPLNHHACANRPCVKEEAGNTPLKRTSCFSPSDSDDSVVLAHVGWQVEPHWISNRFWSNWDFLMEFPPASNMALPMPSDVGCHSGWVSSCRSSPFYSLRALGGCFPVEPQAALEIRVVEFYFPIRSANYLHVHFMLSLSCEYCCLAWTDLWRLIISILLTGMNYVGTGALVKHFE